MCISIANNCNSYTYLKFYNINRHRMLMYIILMIMICYKLTEFVVNCVFYSFMYAIDCISCFLSSVLLSIILRMKIEY